MARIYNKEDYGVGYQGSAQSVGFNPIKAVDLSAREKQRTQNELANLKLTEKTLNRTQSIESAQLKAQQVGESSIMKAEQAQQTANSATMKGLMSLSGTLAKGIGQYKMFEAENKAISDEIDSVFTQPLNGYSLGETPSPVPQEQDQDFGTQQQAAGEATIEVAEGDPVVQSELMAPAINAGISKNKSRSTAYSAAAGYDAFLAGFLEQDVTITRPDGSKFQLNAPESEADLAAVMSLATSTYGREANIRGMDRAAVQRTLIPAVTSANRAIRRERSAIMLKQRNAAAIDNANGTSFDGLGAGDSAGVVFQNTVNSLVGVDGRDKGAAKRDALKILLENAVNLRVDDSVLDELEQYVVPGTGTPLGKGATGAMIQEARRKLEDGVHNDYVRADRADNRAVEALKQERQEALEAAGTDADKIAEVEKDFANRASQFGEQGRKFRNEIMEGGYQDSDVAKDLLQIEADAGNLTIEAIDELEGYDPKFINELKAKVDPNAVKADATVKEYKSDINASANEVTKAIKEGIQIDATGNVTSEAAAKLDIKLRLTKDLRRFARLNPDASPAQVAEEIRSLQKDYIREIEEDKAKAGEAGMNYVYQSKEIPSVNAAVLRSGKGKESGMQYRDLTGLSTGQLRDASFNNTDNDKTNDINPSSDRLLTKKELIEATQLYSSGGAGTLSPRIKELADIVGQDPRVFLEQQNQSYGQSIDLKASDKTRLNAGGIPDATTSNATERKALNIIGRYESDGAGGYDAVNQGGANGGNTVLGYSGPYQQLGGRALTDMSIAEIMELQKEDGRSWDSWFSSGKLHAVGRYQFIGTTLAGIVNQTGLDPNTKFSREVQDSLALYLLRASSNGIAQWVGPNKRALPSEREVVIAARTLSSPTATAAQVRRASKLFR